MQDQGLRMSLCVGKAAGSRVGRCWEAGEVELVADGFRQGLQAAGKAPKMLIHALPPVDHLSQA